MFRTTALVSFGALVAFASLASAQPQPRQLPLSPGVMPGSPFGPGTQFLPTPGPAVLPASAPGTRGGVINRVQPAVGFTTMTPRISPFGFGFGGYPGYGYYGYYGYDTVIDPTITIYPGPAAPLPAPAEPNVVLVNEFPATLTVRFPAAAEVWLDGKKVKGDAAEEVVLTSPVLKENQEYTFLVKARWESKGKTYEAKRAVTLRSGDRSRLSIISGDEVRE